MQKLFAFFAVLVFPLPVAQFTFASEITYDLTVQSLWCDQQANAEALTFRPTILRTGKGRGRSREWVVARAWLQREPHKDAHK